MKHQDQASTRNLEKRLRFLDEFKRIRDLEDGEIEGNIDEKDGDEIQALSDSSRFFLTK
jgi:hypothetical protein